MTGMMILQEHIIWTAALMDHLLYDGTKTLQLNIIFSDFIDFRNIYSDTWTLNLPHKQHPRNPRKLFVINVYNHKNILLQHVLDMGAPNIPGYYKFAVLFSFYFHCKYETDILEPIRIRYHIPIWNKNYFCITRKRCIQLIPFTRL